ncbi:MAG: hypothetical protein MJ176_03395 [Treponema sp.]|nr:hypothetical protein [Treponema sp.]
MLGYQVKEQFLNPKVRIIDSSKMSEYIVDSGNEKLSGGNQRNTKNYIEIGGRIQPSTKYFLQSYQFSESVNNFSGSFSLTIYENIDNTSDECIFSRVKNLDVVLIYEDSRATETNLENKNPVFIGVVHSKQIQSMISNGQVSRMTTISGSGVYSLVGDLSVSLDIHTLTGINAGEVQTKFTSDISNVKNYKQFVEKLWEYFIGISKKVSQSEVKSTNSIFIETILSNFTLIKNQGISGIIDVDSTKETKYPVAASFWTQSVNNFSDMLRSLFPSNIFEIFGRVDEEGNPKIVIREMPFSSSEWSNLRLTGIDPTYLTGYSINQSDSEVYNAFLAYIEGSAEDPSKYATLSAIENRIAKDQEKMQKYGYRPLQVSFRGFDISKEKDNKSTDTINDCTKKMKDWYGSLDELYSGTINLVRGAGDELPRVGERVKFIGFEFYVTDKSHSWNYGGPVNVTLNVSRGASYSKTGERNREAQEKFGLRYAELDGYKK